MLESVRTITPGNLNKPVDAGVRKDYYSSQAKQLPVDAGVRKDYYSGQSEQLTVDAGVRARTITPCILNF